MSYDILDKLNYNVVDYLESLSNPEKVRLSKRWDRDKDYETYSLSEKDYTALPYSNRCPIIAAWDSHA